MSELKKTETTEDDLMLDAPAASRFTGLAISTLAKLRHSGGSPAYLKLGRKILYRRSDLIEWLNARRIRNTAEGLYMPRRLTDDLLPPCK